jgi:hypothetical protein
MQVAASGGSVRRLIAVGIVVLVVAVLGVAQLVLPGVAAQTLRGQLSHNGRVLSVSVNAFPAIELLWHHADSVDVRMASYRVTPATLPDKLGQAADTDSLHAQVESFTDGLLVLHDATLVKRGDTLSASASIAEGDLRAAVPIISSVTPVASANGQLTLQGTATLFGVSATVDATVTAEQGRLVVVPDVPFGGLATLTVFSAPNVSVQSIGASPAPAGFTVYGSATLH